MAENGNSLSPSVLEEKRRLQAERTQRQSELAQLKEQKKEKDKEKALLHVQIAFRHGKISQAAVARDAAEKRLSRITPVYNTKSVTLNAKKEYARTLPDKIRAAQDLVRRLKAEAQANNQEEH